MGGVTSTTAYTYDAAGRLTDVTQDGTLAARYTYDANSNRLSVTRPTGVVSGTYDAQDRLLSYGAVTYTYTANGELRTATSGGVLSVRPPVPSPLDLARSFRKFVPL